MSRYPVDHADVYTENCWAVVLFDTSSWQLDYENDPESAKLRAKVSTNSEFTMKNGLPYFKNKLYVPRAKRSAAVSKAHDGIFALHEGVAGTLFRLDNFWLPTIANDVNAYMGPVRLAN